jgi:hypothetical protein
MWVPTVVRVAVAICKYTLQLITSVNGKEFKLVLLLSICSHQFIAKVLLKFGHV